LEHGIWRRRRRHSQSGPAAAPQPAHHYPWRQLSSAHEKAPGNVDPVFKEKASGIKHDRPFLADCLAYLREGDTLIVTRADRIAHCTLGGSPC